MVRSYNPFKGVNKVCAQCARKCKQFENVILVNCPKFQSTQTETLTPVAMLEVPELKIRGIKCQVKQNLG